MSHPSNRKGIKNLKNTCFMNSVFQLLAGIQELPSSLPLNLPENPQKPLLSLFSSFLKDYSSAKTPIEPKALVNESFKLFPGSKPNTQQDVQEFFYLLIDKLDFQLQDTGTEKIFENLFQGEIFTTINCSLQQKCYKEEFLQLNLAIQSVENDVKNKRTDEELELLNEKNKGFCKIFDSGEKMTINDCLRQCFCNFEEVKQESCLVCGERDTCTKKVELKKQPKYLIVCLKRFAYTKKFSKLSTKVFALKTTLINNSLYELVSVIEHSSFLGRRHYKIFCKDKEDWVKCNDKNITSTKFEKVQNAEPYILMFKLQDPLEARPENFEFQQESKLPSIINSKAVSSRNSAATGPLISAKILPNHVFTSKNSTKSTPSHQFSDSIDGQLPLRKSETINIENLTAYRISTDSLMNKQNSLSFFNPNIPEADMKLAEKSFNEQKDLQERFSFEKSEINSVSIQKSGYGQRDSRDSNRLSFGSIIYDPIGQRKYMSVVPIVQAELTSIPGIKYETIDK